MTLTAATAEESPNERDLPPEAAVLRNELVDALRGYQDLAKGNPTENPVQRLAYDISRNYEAGKLGRSELEGLVQLLTVNAFLFRAKRLRAYVGETGREANTATFRSLIEGLTKDGEGASVSFEVFRARVEREVFGIVITAHPTFGISSELTHTLARLATGTGEAGEPLTEAERDKMLLHVAREHHGTHHRLDLAAEHDFAQESIANIQKALRRIYGIVFEVAASAYPNDWTSLVPRMLTVASWVGYDLDGRSDIQWYHTFLVRMKVEALQLGQYRDAVLSIARSLSDDTEAREILEAAEARLTATLETLAVERGMLEGCTLDTCTGDRTAGEAGSVGAFSRHVTASRESRLIDAGEIIGVLNKALDLTDDDGVKDGIRREILILRAEMANYGLDMSHLHMRLNATQLVNAVRMQLGLEGSPDEQGNRRRYLRAINSLLDEAQPVTINFGSVMGEIASAKRMFMVVAQFLKYVDRVTPIRFLIAECDSPFPVLSALYLARMFGVEDRVDISPLFETAEALEHGHDIVGELLKNPHYCEYVRKRGRICIQTGFSDAGRYIGQTAASLAIERIRMKIAKLMARRMDSLGDVELVIFDTHGESMGRGAHPAGFKDRLDYTYPPACRAQFACAGISVKQEVSFQGGDGYVFFATPEMAFATVCRLLEHALDVPRVDACGTVNEHLERDLFYKDTDYSLEFFIAIKDFNQTMMDNRNYAILLNAFGTNLLYQTGSRKVKRQYDAKAAIDQAHPSQIRAIPHNAILQQMGYLANSVCGIGKAIASDRDRFVQVFKGSERCREFMSLAAHGHRLSSLESLAAYIDLFDPVSWLQLERAETVFGRKQQMRRVSRMVRRTQRHERLNRMFRVFLQDAIDFNEGLDAIGHNDLVPTLVDACHPDLELLHAVRIALIHEIFLLVSRLPKFSNLADVTMDEVVEELLQLDIERAVGTLKRAFPITGISYDGEAFGEEASYHSASAHGYEREHRELFDPMLELYDLMRRVSVGVAHIMGAVG